MTAEFSADEKKRLAPFFTNDDRPVFGLKLPQEVAGALGDAPGWFQLYWPKDPDLTASLLAST